MNTKIEKIIYSLLTIIYGVFLFHIADILNLSEGRFGCVLLIIIGLILGISCVFKKEL